MVGGLACCRGGLGYEGISKSQGQPTALKQEGGTITRQVDEQLWKKVSATKIGGGDEKSRLEM